MPTGNPFAVFKIHVLACAAVHLGKRCFFALLVGHRRTLFGGKDIVNVERQMVYARNLHVLVMRHCFADPAGLQFHGVFIHEMTG